MLKQVCNVEVVIHGIITIKWKNQYELKQKDVEAVKRINERIMKDREEIKIQFDQLKEQNPKHKQKE